MSAGSILEIDYATVCLAAFVSYVIGGVWYAVLFSRAWSRAYGHADGEAIKLWTRPGITLTVLFLGDLVAAIVIAILIVKLGVETMLQGLFVGALLWAGASGVYGLGLQMASGRSVRGFLIDSGRQLVSFALMGAILGLGRG